MFAKELDRKKNLC